jgi:hypothetical protein
LLCAVAADPLRAKRLEDRFPDAQYASLDISRVSSSGDS